MPVAMETKEKGMPEEVQVDEPEDMGAMSAEEAGDTVGCKRKNFLRTTVIGNKSKASDWTI